MRRAFLLPAMFVALLAPLAADIVVTSPNGGESLAQGTKWMISWTAAGIGQNVRILLIKGAGGKFGTIKEGLAPGASPWEWTVGETDAGTAPAGEYKVRITTLDGSQGDISDANFTITPGTTPPPPPPPSGDPTLQVISPNGGEPWVHGSMHDIIWKAENFAGSVDLLLKKYNALTQKEETIGTIASKLPATQGVHSWPVGSLLIGKPSGFGEGYRVRVVKNYEGLFMPKGKPLLADESDNPFKISVSITELTPGLKKLPIIEEHNFVASIQNCHYVLMNVQRQGKDNHWEYRLWEGMPKNLANVGFLWMYNYYENGNYIKQSEVWKSWVNFGIHTERLVGNGKVKEARLVITRKWWTQINFHGAIYNPGICRPCLAGVVLLNSPPPCEWGEIKPNRYAVPSPDGTAIPLGNWSGDHWSVDVTEHLDQIVKGAREDHGFMLYAGFEVDPIQGREWEPYATYLALNAGCFEVSLYVKFARKNTGKP